MRWSRRVLGTALVGALFACTHDFDSFSVGDAGEVDAARDAGVSDSSPPRESGVADASVDAATPCTEPSAVTHGGHCYFVLEGQNDWENSSSACIRAASAHLVTLGSAGEARAIRDLVRGRGSAWIGLRRPDGSPNERDSFVWTTREAVTYEDWDRNEPSGNGACVRMSDSSFEWDDVPCDTMARVVCERE